MAKIPALPGTLSPARELRVAEGFLVRTAGALQSARGSDTAIREVTLRISSRAIGRAAAHTSAGAGESARTALATIDALERSVTGARGDLAGRSGKRLLGRLAAQAREAASMVGSLPPRT